MRWRLINLKQKEHNKHKNLYTAIELRKANNLLKATIRKAKDESWEQYLNSITTNTSTKSIWTKVNRLRKNGDHRSDIFRNRDNALAFLKNCINIENNDSNYPITLEEATEVKDIFQPHLVKKYFKDKKNKAAGYDNISADLLADAPEEVISRFTVIFNDIWRKQRFPEQWRISKNFRILKPGKDKFHVNNYRPVALLPVAVALYSSVVRQNSN